MSRVLTQNGETGESPTPELSTKYITVSELEPIEGKKSYEVVAAAPITEAHRALWTTKSGKLPAGTNNVDAWLRFYFHKFANPKKPVTLCTWGNMLEGRYLELIVLENGKLQLKRNGSSVIGETAGEVPNGKHYAEVRLRHGSTTGNGQGEARLNGESFAVNNACNLGEKLTYDELRIGACSAAGGGGEVRWQFDAIAINNPEGTKDNSWPGALKAEEAPKVTTDEADGIGGAIATLHGTVNPRGLPTKYWFEYGLTEAYGSKTAEVEAGDGEEAVPVEADLEELDPETPYYFRLVAKNAIGETQGEDAIFETGPGPSGEPVATTFVANHEEADPLAEYGLSGIFEKEGVPQGTLSAYTPGYRGGQALEAAIFAPDSYARGIAVKAQTGWQNGQVVAYEIAFWLPKGFFAAKEGQIDIYRWDNFEQDGVTTERGGLVFHSAGRELRAVRIKEGEPDEQVTLVLGPEIEEERWTVAGVVQRLWHEDGLALTELWVEGVKVGESTLRNCTRPDLVVSRLRDGIVASSSKQVSPISIVVDWLRAGPPPLVGPLAPPPPSEPPLSEDIPMPEAVEDLLPTLPGWAQFDPIYRAAARIAARESALMRERLGAVRAGLIPTRESPILLEAWEAMVKLPRNPPGLSTAERWAAVTARLRRAIEDPSGISWVARVSEQIGAGWTYVEEAPDIIRVTVPWAPGSERFLLAERVLERMKPAAWRVILESAEGFVLDRSKLDKEPFHPA